MSIRFWKTETARCGSVLSARWPKLENGVITNYGKPEGLIYPFVQSLFEDVDGRLFLLAHPRLRYSILRTDSFYDFMGKLGAKAGPRFCRH